MSTRSILVVAFALAFGALGLLFGAQRAPSRVRASQFARSPCFREGFTVSPLRKAGRDRLDAHPAQ
jgi:hypothetical protein